MHITKIYIDNFKTYQKFEIQADCDVNVFTGINNSGKTTILEAISLWYECFRYLIKRVERADQALRLVQGNYRLGNKNNNYIDYRKLTAVRTAGYFDIFHNLNPNNPIIISVTLSLENNEELTIPFRINAANGNNYNISLDNHDDFDFVKFNRSFRHLPTPILCIYASPIAAVSTDEEFALAPKIINKVTSRQSFMFLRNRIYKLSFMQEYQQFKDDISLILNNRTTPVSFEIIGDIQNDVDIRVNVKIGIDEKFKDISLLGSGTIQIIELMLAIYEDRKDINLILLDEPDSHIHRDIQKRLVDVLTNYTNNAQVFITTHNESLIRSTKPKNLFHITSTGTNSDITQCKPVINSQLPTTRVGMMPTYHTKILRAVGNENALDLVNAIEAHKLILVEGDDDASNLQKILALQNYSKDIVYWAFRGIDTLIQKISHYKDFLNGIGSGVSLWDKAIIVIDADYMTQDQQRDLIAGFYAKLNIHTHCWSSYTIESTILTDPNVLKTLIHRILVSVGMVLTEDEVAGAISLTIAEFKVAKLDSLANDVVIRSSISAQIATKNKHLTECLNLNRVIQGPATNFFANYELYARQALNTDKISHVCNKDDVEGFCKAVFDKLGVNPITQKSYFQQIADVADPVVCFEEWRNLYNLVNN